MNNIRYKPKYEQEDSVLVKALISFIICLLAIANGLKFFYKERTSPPPPPSFATKRESASPPAQYRSDSTLSSTFCYRQSNKSRCSRHTKCAIQNLK